MALHRTRKCDKFNLKFLGSILAGAVQFVRKETRSNNVRQYKTSQLTGIFYMQIGAHKSEKKTIALSDFVLLLVCHIGRFVLTKNAKKPFVAICFGFSEKNRWFDWTMSMIFFYILGASSPREAKREPRT